MSFKISWANSWLLYLLQRIDPSNVSPAAAEPQLHIQWMSIDPPLAALPMKTSEVL